MKASKIFVGLALAAAACGGASHGTSRVDAHGVVAPPSRGAMKLELFVRAAKGSVLARTRDGGEWKPLAPGQSLAGVRDVQVARRGAIVELGAGDAAGRLWLRGGTTVRLGQDDRGVHVQVRAGRARLRRTAAALPAFVDTARGSVAVDGDVLIQARVYGARPGVAGPRSSAGGGVQYDPTELFATGARPELAEWSLALERPDDGSGVGQMEARGARDTEVLELRRVAVDVRTAGDLAITEVTHVFFNPASENREGTFRFPVPDRAMLTGLAMEIQGKLVEGEIVEREKARETYEKIVDSMQDPALLEWEEGNWFKLRVFPLEAGKEKRVVIRYTSPLARGVNGWEYDYALATPHSTMRIGELAVKVDGTVVAHEKTVTAGLDLSVPVGTDKVPPVMQEIRTGDAVYTAVRIPAPSGLAAPARPGARRVAVIVDTSRSALEGKPLALELVKTALGELAPADKFVVLASDVGVTAHAKDFTPATPAAVDAAVGFLAKIEPDGATDLAAAMTAAAALRPTDVLYVGDGIPTWGERRVPELGALADRIAAPIHAGLVGKGASSELWSEIAGRTGGRAIVVKKSVDAQRFALAAIHAADVPRLGAARVEGPAGATVFPAHASTLYAGDELVALVRTPVDKPAPTELTLVGSANGKTVKRTIALAKPVKVERVAQRWAAYQLVAMETAGAPREDIVKLSTDFGLMSKYTSLLVLENDEMFKQYQIERKKQAEADAAAAAAAAKRGPQITGGDLDTLGAREASLSPDEIQPGDPEIKIPAPQDARQVVVSFPFGETKLAVWDADAAAWMVRFLIDKDTLDGEYHVRITITHADGRIELMTLPYVVDTAPPAVQLTVTKVADGYRIRAKQVPGRDGVRRKDADRVEVVLPDGTVMVLAQTAWGRFEGVWQTAPLATPATLRVVVRDRALNQATRELTIGGAR